MWFPIRLPPGATRPEIVPHIVSANIEPSMAPTRPNGSMVGTTSGVTILIELH